MSVVQNLMALTCRQSIVYSAAIILLLSLGLLTLQPGWIDCLFFKLIEWSDSVVSAQTGR
jgi:hypothetical protein